MSLDQAFSTFVAECRELLEEMESILLSLESNSAAPDAIHALFRGAHTIKGSAGLFFGLERLVEFTHVVESVLDQVRDGEVAMNRDLASLLLRCCDHTSALLAMTTDGAVVDAEQQARLLAGLEAYLSPPASRPLPLSRSEEPTALLLEVSEDGPVAENANWHLSLRFGPDVLRNGMDPASFIRYLATIGEIVSVHTLSDPMPPAEAMDPESCYLGFEIDFKSEADKETIEGVFEFVRADCRIRILPPHARIVEYISLLQEHPDGDQMLGELLVNSGALTRRELEEALRIQRPAPALHGQPIGEILVEQNMVPQPIVAAALHKQTQTRQAKQQENSTIRVDAAKLDHLINLIGELVTAGASTQLLSNRSGNGELLEAATVLARLVEEVRDSALKLRMVPIGATFSRFQRLVRDISQELGKEIELVITGAETELDKSVVERIGDPLMHMVRNAIDHGIERADERLAGGKPAAGRLHLNAFHESGSIVIEVSDDGRGLNRERIWQKALERGLVQPNQHLSDQEVFKLIFEPGFSTADQITNLSGRGVGMDVVMRSINALRGTIELDSQEGHGTTVSIRLPLTLAIIDGFLVEVSGSSFVIPLDMVLECVELSDADRAAMDERHYINLRGQVLPFIRLRDMFQVDGSTGRRENVVVVQYAGQKAGLVVDELMGELQTVIKPLGRIFSHLKGIGGSTVLGTGSVALILDVPALIQQAIASAGQRV